MTMYGGALRIVIPGLARSGRAEEIHLLARTLKSVISRAEGLGEHYSVVSVVQGDRPALAAVTAAVTAAVSPPVHLHYCHLPEPIGKWGAVEIGIEKLSDIGVEDADIVVFMDGDFSFHGTDLARLTAPLRSGESDYAIGYRDIVLLPTPGTSPEERAYAELYINGLVLSGLKRSIGKLAPFDIQCGFQALRYELVREVPFRIVPRKYGGEIVLFETAVRRGKRPISVPVSHHNVSEASFTLDAMLDCVLELPVVRNLSKVQREEAGSVAEVLYQDRIEDREEFRNVVRKVQSYFISRCG